MDDKPAGKFTKEDIEKAHEEIGDLAGTGDFEYSVAEAALIWRQKAVEKEKQRCAEILCEYCRMKKTAYYMNKCGWVHGPGEGIGWTRGCDAAALRASKEQK